MQPTFFGTRKRKKTPTKEHNRNRRVDGRRRKTGMENLPLWLQNPEERCRSSDGEIERERVRRAV